MRPESARNLRQELLYDGLYDWVSLAEADSDADKFCPDVPEPQRRELLLDTLRELVVEGLFDAGSLDTPDGRFAAFDEPLDEVMARIRHAYIDCNDDTSHWVFRFWFELTDKGTAVATETDYGRELARGVEEDVRRLAADQELQSDPLYRGGRGSQYRLPDSTVVRFGHSKKFGPTIAISIPKGQATLPDGRLIKVHVDPANGGDINFPTLPAP
ncbi:hypothetical protein QN239_32065 [Mycolicibacterium sp. Y3]